MANTSQTLSTSFCSYMRVMFSEVSSYRSVHVAEQEKSEPGLISQFPGGPLYSTTYPKNIQFVSRRSVTCTSLSQAKCRATCLSSCNLRRCFLWAEPITNSVPECLSSTLQTLEWRGYTDTQFDKDVISFLLKNATCLTKVKIVPVSTAGHIEKLRIRTYLTNLSRGSTACQLIFP
ncbi:hypothetical protein Bca52824_034633 [Brassica carinata]|uniref:FBD domain-containing protein n=1 Tax=Brassica carinata TaxID=52824 RepID=A0A8X7V3D5_BRACI|nr:hypothetical protein Bca52824_034633 [Brassica carinata]